MLSSRRRPMVQKSTSTSRRAALVLAGAVAHALGVGLVLHLVHGDAHEAVPIGPLAHWLRDSLLSAPASLAALLLAGVAASRGARWVGIRPGSPAARVSWALIAALAYAVASVPGNAIHAGLFGAEHEGMAFAAHAVRDGGIVYVASFFLLIGALSAERPARAIATRLRRPAAGRRPRARRTLLGASTAGLIAVTVILAGPKGFEEGISGALVGGTCPSGSRTVVYDIAAFQTVIPLNGWGDKLPDGLVYALKNADARVGKQDILANPKLTQPLTIRANVGDCIKVRLRNDIAGRRIGIHTSGLAQADPKDSDGARVGNNPDTTIATGASREYTWYADHAGEAPVSDIANIDGADPKVPTVQRGLYGALIVHPKGTSWHNPKTGNNMLSDAGDGTLRAVESAIFADVRDPAGADHRSYAMVMLDENEGVVDRNGNTPTFPASGLEDSTFGINYRSEPLRNRLRAILEHRGTVTPENRTGVKKTIQLPNGKVIDPEDHFCDGYVPELDKVVTDPGARCMSEESHLQSWVFGDEGKLTHTVDEVQKVSVAAAAEGTFTLTFKGETTAPIPLDAGPQTVQDALVALPAIRPGDVVAAASDTAVGTTASTGGVNVTFTYRFGGQNVPAMTGGGASIATKTEGDGIRVDSDNLVAKSYRDDRVKFHVIHPGAQETHPWHQHTQRWHADPNNRNGANGTNNSPLNDVQSIGPGDAREFDLEHGAGGDQRTIGDSIFHCHLYPHFAQGFWGHLRIFDRLRDGTQTYVDKTPLEPLKELPDQGGKTPAPDAAHPGFPLFVKGDFGQRAYRPPNAVIKDDFASLRRPGDAPRGPTAAEAANLPGLSAAKVSADGKTNLTERPGAGFIDPCPSTANLRVYKPHAVDTPITYNGAKWKDREGRVYVEGEEGVAAVRAGRNPEPYTIRSRIGECVQLQTSNDLHLDDDPNVPVDHLNKNDGDYFHEEETSEVSTHVHLVQFDELGSDGTSVGWNYSQSAMPGQTYGYRWYVDVALRTVFFHDHQYANLHQQKGLYAAMNVEPVDAEWRDPQTGRPTNGVGPIADIISPSGKDFREFTVFFGDRAPMWKSDGAGAPVNPPPAVDDYGADQGASTLNLRNEPYQIRTNPNATGPKGDPAYVHSSSVHGDPATPVLKAYSQDPVVIRNVSGSHEEAHTFSLHGHRWLNEPDNPKSALSDNQSQTLAEYFNYEVQGGQVVKANGGPQKTLQAASNSYANGTPAILQSGAGRPGDYLYGSTHLDDMWLGAWGIFRVPAGKTDLQVLPDQAADNNVPDPIDPWPALRPGEPISAAKGVGVNPCPTQAPIRAYDVTALRTKITYNAKTGDHDPNGLLYAPTSDASTTSAGVATLKAGVTPKPLFLRANAGDCIKLTLRNGLPVMGLPQHDGDVPLPADAPFPSSARVSIHASMVKYDPLRNDGATVGYNYDQTVAPGKSLTQTWYADPALEGATTNLVDFGDRRGHRHHGLWGGLMIEPKGATWKDPRTGASLEGVKNPRTGVIEGTKTAEAANVSYVAADGTTKKFREFVADWQDGLNLRKPDGTPVPTAGEVDDPYERGHRGINYRTERFAPRLAKDPEQANVLSSVVHGDPDTPVFQAYVGDPVKFRVLEGSDRGRAHQFMLNGHEWPNQYTDPTSFLRGSQEGLLTGRAFTFNLVGGAGGRQGASGDYLFRDGLLRNQVNAGLWGLLRVHASPQANVPPL